MSTLCRHLGRFLMICRHEKKMLTTALVSNNLGFLKILKVSEWQYAVSETTGFRINRNNRNILCAW